jgi:hypothetical protein
VDKFLASIDYPWTARMFCSQAGLCPLLLKPLLPVGAFPTQLSWSWR